MTTKKNGEPRKKNKPPHKFDAEKKARVIKALREGATRGSAYGSVAISDSCFDYHLNRDLEFFEAVTQAEHEAEALFARSLTVAATTGHEVVKTKTVTKANGDIETTTERYFERDWRAAESWLKRRRRKEWSDQTVVVGPNDGPVQIEVVYIDIPKNHKDKMA